MEKQFEMYQKAIDDLKDVQLKSVELEVKRMKLSAFGLAIGILAMAFFLLL